MSNRTRYFVIASLLVMTVGLGTGLVAYYVGLPDGVAQSGAAANLRLLPRDSHLVAYANVRRVMDSELRQRLRTLLPISGQGQRELVDQTGINIDTDIEEILTCLAPSHSSAPNEKTDPLPLALARGRFDVARLENLMETKGGRVETYKGVKLIVVSDNRPSTPGDPVVAPAANAFAVSFIEPELAALGSIALIRNAIDQRSASAGVTDSQELMTLVKAMGGSDLWAVGDLEALRSQTRFPAQLTNQLPGITRFAAAVDVNADLSGTLRADTRDQASADDLRQVIQGLIALGRLNMRSRPELKPFLDSITLGGSGTTVSLSFDVPAQIFDLLGKAVAPAPNARPNAPAPAR